MEGMGGEGMEGAEGSPQPGEPPAPVAPSQASGEQQPRQTPKVDDRPGRATGGEGDIGGALEQPHKPSKLRLAYEAGAEDEAESDPETSARIHLDPGVTARVNLSQNTAVNLDQERKTDKG
jgi:hypothetical protein